MSSFTRAITGCLLIVLVLGIEGCGREPPAQKSTDPVVATVGARVITVPELRDELRPPRFRAGPPPANVEHRRRTLERIVSLELTEHVARERGLLEDPRYSERARAVEREARRWKQEALRRLLAEELVEDFIPPEAEVRTHYEESRARFRGTLLHLREIVTAEEADAMEALQQVREGVPFREVAQSSSIAPSASEGGRIGPFDPGLVPEDLIPQVRRLRKPEDLAGPFQEPRGWTILLLEKRETGVPQELDQVRPTIERMLRRQEMEKRYEELIAEARQQVGVSIDEATLTDDALFGTEPAQ
jgi:peptidyl-prolyl cis-trans isomerase C